MEKLLFAAGTAFLRAFGVAFLSFSIGILAAPNVSTATALSIAALLGSIVAGLRAIQVFIPQLSFASLLPQPWGAYADSFARAFLATLVTGLVGVLSMPDFQTSKAAWIAVVTGALTAGLRALQGFFTSGHQPVASTGF
jgi:hypothetical protein